jgi:beta-lactamase regulating signal transducer with metallopeptidase domain
MIGDLMLYGTTIAALFGLTGLALERIAAWIGFARRGAWAVTLIFSLAFPTMKLLVPHRPTPPPVISVALSNLRSEESSNIATPAVRDSTDTAPHAVVEPLPQHYFMWPTQASLEKVLRPLWLASSSGLVGFYALLWLRLRVEARRWRRAKLKDQEVWVTQALGPAVYGFIRPIILVPQWVIDGPDLERALVLAHEQEHIAARDPGLLLLGLLLVAIAPWNLPLWWQLRRLRFAMEVDCDARVLGRGAEARAYGQVLLSIGQRRSFAPAGAIALTEPASQLLRRIRIMTTPVPRHVRWLLAAAIGLSLTCFAVASELRPPALSTNSQQAATSVDALRKPPLIEDPRQAVIQKVVRSIYPELFSASAAPGWVAVMLLMNPDGTLYKNYKEDTQPRGYFINQRKAFDAMGVDIEHHGDRVNLEMQGGPAGGTRVYVRTYFLKPASDPTRDVALVRAKVNQRYRSLYIPVTEDRLNELTVFMTESGDIERAQVESTEADAEVVPTPEHFIAMGIPREQIGPMDKATLFEGPYVDGKAERLLVIYAWPRRANELAPKPWQPEQPGPAAPNDDPVVNRAIAEKYFPDLYTYTAPKNEQTADPWVLLDREGKVLSTGRRFGNSRADLKLFLESLYPGIRTDGFQPTTLRDDRVREVNFMWLAADSPVTELSKADLSKRSDVALYADVIDEGSAAFTTLIVLKFGSPAIAVCDGKDLDLQVTATDAGADTVMLRARIQHVARARPLEYGIPNAVESAWSPETPPVRVRYGKSAEVQVTDQDHKTWKVVLHPDRMQGAST